MSIKAFLAGFVMVGLAAAAEAQQPTSIGTLGGTNSYGKSINASGQVAGWSDRSTDWWDTQQIAFLWTPETPNGTTGTMVSLGTLGGDHSWANGINDHGQAVGMSNVPAGTGGDRAFVWTPGTTNGSVGSMASIGVLGDGWSSEAYAINNAGQIAGWSYWTSDPAHENEQRAFLWTPDSPNGSTGTMGNLGSLGGSWSVATAISQNGKVAGYSALPDGRAHAFLWTPGGTAGPASNPQMQDLGLLNGYDTLALGVNSAGQVSGVDMSPGAGRPWLWTPGGSAGFPDNPQMQDLGTFGGTFGGFATGITETGAVTGAAYLFGNATTNSFIWVPEAPNSTTGTMMNTGTLLGPRIAPWSINASGQIAGWADVDSNGMTHAFVTGPFSLGGNEAPTAEDQQVLVQKDKSTIITLTGSDPEDASLSFIVVTAPAHGNLTGTGAVLTYKPARGFEGADSFTFKVNDGQADSPVATVSIEVGKKPKPSKK